MKLRNQTHWNTKQLRAIVSRASLNEVEPAQYKRLRVTVKYGKHFGTHVSGWCDCVGGDTYTLYVQKGGINREDLALTAAHEAAHCHGKQHRDMNTARYRRVGVPSTFYVWAKTMPLEKKTVKPKPTTADRRSKRLAIAQAALKRWERKVKLANTKLKYWRKRVNIVTRQVHSTSGVSEELPECTV